MGSESSRKATHEQMDFQREFAQMGLQWKADDARRAGLHPLAALGASGYSASPVSVGQDPLAGAIGDAGQEISRSMLAAQDQTRRDEAARELARFNRKAEFQRDQLYGEDLVNKKLANERANLENTMLWNQYLDSTRRRLNQQLGPGMPTDGEPDPLSADPRVRLRPSEQVRSELGVSSREATIGGRGKPGMVPYRFGGDRFGFTMDVPHQDVAEGFEGMGPGGWIPAAAALYGHYSGMGLEWLEDKRQEARRKLWGNAPYRR